MGMTKLLAWLLDGLRRFQLLYDLVPLKPRTMYFPGDDIFLVGEKASVVQKKQSERASKVVKFVRSGDFVYQVIVACVSSLPRWHFIRSLNAKDGNSREKDDADGLWRAV